MTARSDELKGLAERILEDRTGQLTAAELDALLTWLAGGERRGAGVLIDQLGSPGDQPQLLRQIYEDLDDALFSPDGLEVEAAFVSAHEEDSVRKARYRRLMNAFHPDRFADRADWMTSRSQSIHAAYQAYRRGEPNANAVATASPAPETGSYRPRGPRGSARLTPSEPGPLRWLRWRLRNVEHLQAKILGGLAALTVVPLLLVYLLAPSPTPNTVAVTEPDASTPPSPAETPQDRVLAQSQPPAEPAPEPEPSQDRETRTPEPILPDPVLSEALSARIDLSDTRFDPPQETRPEPEPEPVPEPEPEPTRDREIRTPDPVTRKPAPEPEPDPEPAPAPPPEPDPEPEPVPTPEPEPTREPETRTPEPVTRKPEPKPIEVKVANLLSAYEAAFSAGNLEAFMAVLADNPRENRNRGRDWFEASYQRLFTNSTSRRLEVTVARVEPVTEGWRVTAMFELWVAYPNRRPTHSERLIHYTLTPDSDGHLRIAAIDY